MEKIKIERANLEAAYKVAVEETKKVLDALFGRTMEPKKKPTLDDYTTIKTYEDACEALEEAGITNGYIYKEFDSWNPLSSHIVALMKLETISRALRGRGWKPTDDLLNKEIFYIPLFGMKNGTLAPPDDTYPVRPYNSGYIDTPITLCQETQEKAEYFGRQFIDLWAEHLGFDTEKKDGE